MCVAIKEAQRRLEARGKTLTNVRLHASGSGLDGDFIPQSYHPTPFYILFGFWFDKVTGKSDDTLKDIESRWKAGGVTRLKNVDYDMSMDYSKSGLDGKFDTGRIIDYVKKYYSIENNVVHGIHYRVDQSDGKAHPEVVPEPDFDPEPCSCGECRKCIPVCVWGSLWRPDVLEKDKVRLGRISYGTRRRLMEYLLKDTVSAGIPRRS